MTRILLFEPELRGHSEVYLRRFVDVLGARHDVLVAVPPQLAEALADLPAETIVVPAGLSARDHAEAFGDAARRVRADHALHVFADEVLWWLLRRPPSEAAVSALVFRPRLHYPSAYGLPLTPRERVRATAHELVVSAWRRRPDAHALLTLDEGAAAWWNARPGARAVWLPEPPLAVVPRAVGSAREGCVLFGVLAERKGIELLANALEAGTPAPITVVLAGPVDAPFRGRLTDLARRMESAGAAVELRDGRLEEQDALDLLASARCVLLPYPHHYGMSRVLVEASAAGTPVLVNEGGLVAHLVRRHSLGRTVDCADSHEFRAELLALAGEEDGPARYAPALARFARKHAAGRFGAALESAFSVAGTT